MEEVFFKVNFIPDKNFWEMTINDKIYFVSQEEFTILANSVRDRYLSPGTFGDMVFKINNDNKCVLKNVSSQQAMKLINYLVKCEDSHKLWLNRTNSALQQSGDLSGFWWI